MSNRVTHFEIPCDDPQSTIEFFQNVFGWTFTKFGDQDYWFARTGSEDQPGINGAIMKKNHPDQPLTNSILVDNLDDIVSKISQSGGTIVVPKFAIPGMGWLSFFKDPDGNIHGVWEEDKAAG